VDAKRLSVVVSSNAWYDAAYPDPNTVDPAVYDRGINPYAQTWFLSEDDVQVVLNPHP
jgi:hypothetical protein